LFSTALTALPFFFFYLTLYPTHSCTPCPLSSFHHSYIKSIKELSEKKGLSSRIRFMCKDLLEMRENGWNARREEEKAKTIAQIHKVGCC
jgi:hypothetical protein